MHFTNAWFCVLVVMTMMSLESRGYKAVVHDALLVRTKDSMLWFCCLTLDRLSFTCVSYAEALNSYRLDVRPSVRHTLVLYQNG